MDNLYTFLFAGIAIGYVIFVVILPRYEKSKTTQATDEWDFLRAKPEDNVTVDLKITVRKRWVPHLLGFFHRMEELGNIGSSRMIGFYADGDGDFRPSFEVGGEPIKDPVYKTSVEVPIRAAGDASSQKLTEWFDAG